MDNRILANIKRIVHAKVGTVLYVLPSTRARFGLAEYVTVVPYGKYVCDNPDKLSIIIAL